MSPADSLLIAALLTLAAFIEGLLGFGFGIVAMAGLTLTFDLVHAAGLVNLASLALGGMLFWRLRAHVLRPVVGRIAPWLLGGVLLGVLALRSLDGALLVRALGVVVITAAAWNLSGRALHVPQTITGDALAGVLSGVFGGAFNTGGPPLIAYVYSRPGAPEMLKGTLQALFLCTSVARIPLAAAQGLLDASMVVHGALAVPFVAAGQRLGVALSERLAGHQFRRLAWGGLGALGVVLLLRG